MSYECIECGAKVDYDKVVEDNMVCTKCTRKRSNIWIKRRPKNTIKTIIAR